MPTVWALFKKIFCAYIRSRASVVTPSWRLKKPRANLFPVHVVQLSIL